jgi:hypothetical protein
MVPVNALYTRWAKFESVLLVTHNHAIQSNQSIPWDYIYSCRIILVHYNI